MSFFDKKLLNKAPRDLTQIIEKLFSKGKSFRCSLIRLISRRLRLKEHEQRFLCLLVESIHNSSLLHDDFIDRSRSRRGRPAAWIEFSPPLAVLTGDYLLAYVSARLADLGNLLLIRLTADVIQSLVRGEFLQYEMSQSGKWSARKVKKASALKTGSLFIWALQAPFLYKNRREKKLLQALHRLGSDMGVLFQRSDDLIDFALKKGSGKKPFADLKQNYLNSFACFLAEKRGEDFVSRLKKVQNFKAFKNLVPDYPNHVKEFHQINQKRILKVQKDMDCLSRLLKPYERELTEDLKTAVLACYQRSN